MLRSNLQELGTDQVVCFQCQYTKDTYCKSGSFGSMSLEDIELGVKDKEDETGELSF